MFVFIETENLIKAGIAESESPRLLVAFDDRTMTAVAVRVELLEGVPLPTAWTCAGPMPREAVSEWAENLAAGMSAGTAADARVLN